jgi:hypothetical protein
LREAETKRRWLIVNIQDTIEFASQQLNRDTWKDAGVQSLIEAQCVFWQSARETLDSKRLSTLYNITTFPAIIFIDPRTGELVRQFSGFVAPERLADESEPSNSSSV